VFTPGATTVGWNSGLPNSPREEKLASRPRLSVAPVLMTHGATEYGFNESVPGPVLPAEKTTLTPLSVSILVAMFTGSLTSKTVFAEKLQLTTRTLKAAAFANKYSNPESTNRRLASPALNPRMFAPGATPAYLPL